MSTVSNNHRQAAIFASATVLFHVAFLCGMASWLWSREHYQFFPIVLIASGIFAWFRLEDAEWNHRPQLTLRIIFLSVICLLLFTGAAIFQSNWLGTISAILSLWTGVWLFGGSDLASRLRGPVFMLFLAVPLPLNLDLRLVVELQKIASSVASSLLDMQRVRHVLSGVAINTVDRGFMVEEACSGIHSLFSCLCVVVMTSMIQRQAFVRVLINILQTIGWVIAANSIRVFLIVYGYTNWDLALDSGWRHDALGVFTYSLALIMSLSTDRFFQFIIPPGRGGVGQTETNYKPTDNVIKEVGEMLKGDTNRISHALNIARANEHNSWRAIVAVLFLFSPLAALSYANVLQTRTATANVATGPNFVGGMSQALSDDSLPQSVLNWNLAKVERISRSPNDPLGTNSTIFSYTGGGLAVGFSVDGFYNAWHDLAFCYTALDWKIKSQTNDVDESTKAHRTRLDLYTDDGQHAICLFSCYDSQLESVSPGEATLGTIKTLQTLLDRLPINQNDRSAQVVPPVVQFQLFCSSRHELLDHEIAEIQALYNTLSNDTLRALAESAQ